MATIDTRPNKLGNVVKYEQGKQHGFCRETVTATLLPESKIGDVYANVSGTWELVTVATSGNELGILVDPDSEELAPESGTSDESVAMLVRGGSIVADQQLNYGADIDTQGEIDAVVAQLESQGILVRTQV